MAINTFPSVSGTVSSTLTAMGGSLTWTSAANAVAQTRYYTIDLGGSLPPASYTITTTRLNILTNKTNTNMIVNPLDSSGNKISGGYSGLVTTPFNISPTSSFSKLSFYSPNGCFIGNSTTVIVITPGNIQPTTTATMTRTLGATASVSSGWGNTAAVSSPFYGVTYFNGTSTWTSWANITNPQTVGWIKDTNGTITNGVNNTAATNGQYTNALNTSTGVLYYGGGQDVNGTTISNWYKSDANGTQTALTAIPDVFTYAPSSIVVGTKVYLLGGRKDITNTPTLDTTARLRVYDITGNSWTTLASAPTSFTLHTNGYGVGSWYDSTGGNIYFEFDSGYVAYYNIAGNTWTSVSTTANAMRSYGWAQTSRVKDGFNDGTNIYYAGGGSAVINRVRISDILTANSFGNESLYTLTTTNDNAAYTAYLASGNIFALGCTKSGNTIYAHFVGVMSSATTYLRLNFDLTTYPSIPSNVL